MVVRVDLSIVIPCRNGAATIERQLRAIERQDLVGWTWEVIVADNGSTDASKEKVATFSVVSTRVRLIDASERVGINFARNAGVRAAHGRFIILSDADDVVHEGWLQAYARAILGGAMCVGGAIVRTLPDGEVVSREYGIYHVYDYLPWAIGANCGFAREVFDSIGGFDESFRGGGDETDFFWRAAQAGYELTAVKDAVTTYYARDSARAVARQWFAYGRAGAQLFSKHRSGGMPRAALWKVPFAWGAGVGHLLLGVLDRRSRRKGIGLLCDRSGRLVGSVAQRVLFL